MPTGCDYRINDDQEIVDKWFCDEREWNYFLQDCFSADNLNECHKCTRRFMPLIRDSSRKNARNFLSWFSLVCPKCKVHIYNYCDPKNLLLAGKKGEFKVKLVQKWYNGILVDKDKNKRVINTAISPKKTAASSSKKTTTLSPKTVQKSKSYPPDKLKTVKKSAIKPEKREIVFLTDMPRENRETSPVKMVKKSQKKVIKRKK